jgi:hypothetical protein
MGLVFIFYIGVASFCVSVGLCKIVNMGSHQLNFLEHTKLILVQLLPGHGKVLCTGPLATGFSTHWKNVEV